MAIFKKYITPSKYCRPQKAMPKIEKIILHWISVPNSTALNNVKYCDGMGTNPNPRYGSFHEIVEQNGDIYIAIPANEVSINCGTSNYNNYTDFGKFLRDKYGSPNYCTYSMEMCHPDSTGKPTYETYNALVSRFAYLCLIYNLNPINDIIRHSDIVSQNAKPPCPRWFVLNQDEWDKFKIKVRDKMESNDWKDKMGRDALIYLKNEKVLSDISQFENIDLVNTSMPFYLSLELLKRVLDRSEDRYDEIEKDIMNKLIR